VTIAVLVVAALAGKYALHGLLGPQQEVAFNEVLDVCSLLWRKVFTAADLAALQPWVCKALHLLELAFPASLMSIITHSMLHLVDKVERVGPLCNTSMYPYERYNRVCKSWTTNKSKPTASIAQNAKSHTMSVLHKAQHAHMFSDNGDWLFDAALPVDKEDGDISDPLQLPSYMPNASGTWGVTTGMGRKPQGAQRNVLAESWEHIELHHYFYCSNREYGDLFDRCMGDYLASMPPEQHPQQRDGAYLWHAWSQPKVRNSAYCSGCNRAQGSLPLPLLQQGKTLCRDA
jgi:hypothetical protein